MSGPGEDGAKRAVRGTLVKVLLHRRTDRGMTLEPYTSRCVRRGELHELVATDQDGAGPGARIDRVGFLGFAELTCAGVVDRGDGCWIGGRLVGTVLGFDACHFPNHYNILIATGPVTVGAITTGAATTAAVAAAAGRRETDRLPTGGSLGLRAELPVAFTASPVTPP